MDSDQKIEDGILVTAKVAVTVGGIADLIPIKF